MQFEDEFKESQPLIEAKIESENKEEISGEETTETVEELDKQQEEHSSYGYDSSEHMNDGDLDGGVDSKVPELEQQESESSTNIYRDLYGTNTQDDWVKKLYEAKNRYLERQGKEQPESAVVSTDATAPIARVERMVTTIKVADKQLEPFLVASEDFDSSGLLISDLEFEPWGDKNKRNGGKRKFEQIEGTEKQGEKENGGIESINSGKGTTIPLDELSTSDIYWTRFVNKVSNNIINKLADFVSKENFKPSVDMAVENTNINHKRIILAGVVGRRMILTHFHPKRALAMQAVPGLRVGHGRRNSS
ncbi:hypothetical protein AX774_g3305 [Zancudomyces culisetae]|uniref:Uncharacterized protein n=1 Tax=Zancudomyces culisetae TaxID=1213189 RepID=A0A1R1PQP2_ZANCU|nr:hypothetical protein AX774_g3305 [Zancudomyces culisetae]|eukprot:OMH83192.1 hypothetical protein AX774_g3305 [Zancudomyces culisetae]